LEFNQPAFHHGGKIYRFHSQGEQEVLNSNYQKLTRNYHKYFIFNNNYQQLVSNYQQLFF